MKYKYTKDLLEPLVAESNTLADVMRKLGVRISGGNHKYIKHAVARFGIDTSHFLGQASRTGKSNGCKKPWQEILVLREDSSYRQGAHILRRALIESGRDYKCASCGQDNSWNGKSLVLEVHHKDRNWLDDRPGNLDFVCPNCHSQE